MTKINADDILLTRKEAALYIGMKYNTLAKWECHGNLELEPIRIGNHRVRYRRSALDNYINRRLLKSHKSKQ